MCVRTRSCILVSYECYLEMFDCYDLHLSENTKIRPLIITSYIHDRLKPARKYNYECTHMRIWHMRVRYMKVNIIEE